MLIALYGIVKIYSRGQIIEDIISTSSLSILNNGEKTYFNEPTKTFHTTNLSFCTPTFFTFCDFWVDNDLQDTDHFSVHFESIGHNSNLWKRAQNIFIRKQTGKLIKNLQILDKIIQGDMNSAIDNITYCIWIYTCSRYLNP